MSDDRKAEARRMPRYPVRISAMLHSTIGRYGGMMLDLSPHGCRVSTGMPLATGATLDLEFAMPIGNNSLVQIQEAIVRWANRSQYGLEFLLLAPQHEVSLRHIVSDVHH